MSRLLESIKLFDGQVYNLEYHQRRVSQSFEKLSWESPNWSLQDVISIPEEYKKGLYKIRLIYQKQIEYIEFVSYQTKTISKLNLVEVGNLDYSLKYEDRSEINQFKALFPKGEDILMLKKGLLTDTSYCNIALGNKKDWLTPKQPLLHGTKRAELLERGILQETDLSKEDLSQFSQIRLFNAMMDKTYLYQLEKDRLILQNLSTV